MSGADRLREAAECLRGFPADDLINEPLADWLDVTANVDEAGYHEAPPAAQAVADAILGGGRR